ncbi:uncharacterized protein C8A04DRAFT_30948 [Dichotomopilus funicola]|uniref:Uncharacterized protein n=1 Tax=Dichotomopilus funicola TaxID=1934379 RepID=A0AAN6UZQ4_9PEZI|nr:hypothetical protein C8A04DRAFT_30948 [Dichotomopilus funicola]
MAPAVKRADDPFIITTSLDKPDASTRRYIRSHVMRGKNVGKFRPKKNSPKSDASSDTSDKPELASARTDKRDIRKERIVRGQVEVWSPVTPRKIMSELSFLGLDSEIQHQGYGLMQTAFTAVKPTLYGLGALTGRGPTDELFCFTNIAQHPGLLHSTLFATQAFHDLTVSHAYGPVARRHLAKALRHLQIRLDDQQQAVELSTTAIVASLAMAAVLIGDHETAAKHMDGLKKIVDLRGGLSSLGENSMIVYKAKSLDIGLAMAFGQPLRFLRASDISWSPQFAEGRSASQFPELQAVMQRYGRPDPRLLNVWADLRALTKAINGVTSCGGGISADTANQLAQSLPQRLIQLGLENEVKGGHPSSRVSLHELLRLGMMAYAKTLLVKMPGIGKKMTHLVDGLRTVLATWHAEVSIHLAWEHGAPAEVRKLVLWVVAVSAVSIFEGLDEGWIVGLMRELLSALGLRTWFEVHGVLESFLWIDSVFDVPGKALISSLMV